jgi:hypothetical protein
VYSASRRSISGNDFGPNSTSVSLARMPA